MTLGLAAYVWYFIMIFFIVFWIQRHIEDKVVIPFNSLYEKIWLLIIDPMVLVSTKKLEKIAGMYSMVKSKNEKDVSMNGRGSPIRSSIDNVKEGKGLI